jgi:hypothetical protein
MNFLNVSSSEDLYAYWNSIINTLIFQLLGQSVSSVTLASILSLRGDVTLVMLLLLES